MTATRASAMVQVLVSRWFVIATVDSLTRVGTGPRSGRRRSCQTPLLDRRVRQFPHGDDLLAGVMFVVVGGVRVLGNGASYFGLTLLGVGQPIGGRRLRFLL